MSAAAKQKKNQAVITRTTAQDALFRYVLGLILTVFGLAVLAAMLSSGGGVAFRLIRERLFGLTGSFPWPLPILMVWTGGAMMLSCYHSVNWRSILFSWLLYLSVLALMTMLTYVNGVGPLMSYIRTYNREQRPGQSPGSFISYFSQIYEWGINGRYPYCGGGAMSMVLAYPAFQLFGNTLGIIILMVSAVCCLLAALRVRVGALISGSSDWLEKKRRQRWEESKAGQNQNPQERPEPQDASYQTQGAAYTYDTFDQIDPVPPAGADMERPYTPDNMPDAAGSSRFVAVGDGNTLYNEDFVLHPKQKEKERRSRHTGTGEPAGTVREDGSTEAVFSSPAMESTSTPLPSDVLPQQPDPDLAGYESETIPMTETDFMPPERTSRTAGRSGRPAEQAKPEEKRVSPAKKTDSGRTAQPAQKPEMIPDSEQDSESKELSEWQIQLNEVTKGLFSAQAGKKNQPGKKEVVDTDPAVQMDQPIRIAPARKADTSSEPDSRGSARLDDTPAQKTVKPVNPFASQPYTPPPISFLSEPKLINREESTQEDVRRAQQIERTLSTFNIQTKVCEITHGPAITRFALKIAEGVKVKQVVGVLDNIALEMGSDRLRIEAPIPGTSYIGIEVPNSIVSSVTLREVLDSEDMHNAKSPLVVALGKDIAGKPILCDLSRMPHLLIAGATGSGKSVCINSIVCSLLYRASPEDVRLIMVDPKQVELQVYNGIPHLLIPVISDPKKASTALSWVVNEMFDRYRSFSSMGVRNLEGYNKKAGKGKKLPNIVVIIDEMADLMEVCRKDVEESVRRLAALARAAGIYMVLATQRPSVDVITGVIKNNIPSRIAFTVSSGVDSRTIIDVNGAEKLMGKGDMLYQPTGASKPTRVQGCFVSDDEVAHITENIVARYRADYNTDIQSQMEEAQDGGRNGGEESASDTLDGEFNDLLTNAVRMAVEDGQTSISMLQRRLRIGYARAGRLVDEMTNMGIVSESEGSKPRKVLMTREQFMEWIKENGGNA